MKSQRNRIKWATVTPVTMLLSLIQVIRLVLWFSELFFLSLHSDKLSIFCNLLLGHEFRLKLSYIHVIYMNTCTWDCGYLSAVSFFQNFIFWFRSQMSEKIYRFTCVAVLSELLFRFIFCAEFYWQIGHFSDQTKHTLYMETFTHLMYFLYLMRLTFLLISYCDQAEFYKSFYWELILLFFALQKISNSQSAVKYSNLPNNRVGPFNCVGSKFLRY